MAKKKDFSRYKIEEIVATISEKKNSDWGKFIVKASMDDKPSTIDIRNLKIAPNGDITLGKGISLSNEEVDSLVEILIMVGFGNKNKIENLLSDREKQYGFVAEGDE